MEIVTIECGHVNCYIVSEDGNAVLIDTGTAPFSESVLKKCEPYNIRLILLTHGHVDHTENAAFLSEKLGAPIAMHKSDVNMITDRSAQPMSACTKPGEMLLQNIAKDSQNGSELSVFTPMVFLDEGDSLEEYGINAKIMHLPGHTDGSIAVDVDGKHLFVGDALFNMRSPAVAIIYHDYEAAQKSARKITSLGDRTVYFGHGAPLNNQEWK